MRRVHARVRGRVQGVAYRASTRHEARRLGLAGWVRNLPDGSVELEAQGPTDVVEQLLAWCRKGPSLARVTSVDVTELPVDRTADAEFDVRF
ncbi:MAG: acylphosphatase [Deltaproteobacteria bacterium]|nr:acylphosphatase [Kofleriaceae bacterium]